MWTVQTKVVLDAIERDGVSYVKKEYLRKKYQESSWIFETAYNFMIRKAQKVLPKPEEAESMIWMFREPKWAASGAGGYRICLEVPKDQIVFFDLRNWQKMLGLSLIGTPAEENAFEKEMERMGISHSSDVFVNSFYPMQKRKIMQSWEKILDIEGVEEEYIQGATWMIRKEWIKGIDEYSL